MSQEVPAPKTEEKSPEPDTLDKYPALQWMRVESSVPVHTFTNYKLKLNGWVRKDKLRHEEPEDEAADDSHEHEHEHGHDNEHDQEHDDDHDSETEATENVQPKEDGDVPTANGSH